MKEINRLLVFTDPGLDDAMALIYLLKHLSNKVRIDIFCVGGNNSALVSYQNACSLLASCNREEVYLWKTDNISQKYDTLVNVHGSNFLGLPFSEFANTKVYPDEWEEICDNCSILVLAACTIPLSLDIDNKYINDLIIMGGCELQPNYNGLEFNQAMDSCAFSDFINKYIDKARIITVDSCRNSLFDLYTSNYQAYLDIQSTEYKCYNLYKEYALRRGSTFCIPYDLIAAYALIHKESIIYKQKSLIGIERIKPICMIGADLQNSTEFWRTIWEK